MQPYVLHLDDALEHQPELCSRAVQVDLKSTARPVRLWGKTKKLETLKQQLQRQIFSVQTPPKIIFMGSGDFHHVSALLIELTAARTAEPFTVVHVDNHPDWVNFKGGMHCGSWINQALSLPKVQRLITLGVCSEDLAKPQRKNANLSGLSSGRHVLFPYDHAPSEVENDFGAGAGHHQSGKHIIWHNIKTMGEAIFIQQLLAIIPTQNIYITIDKDVLSIAATATNWDQGQMTFAMLQNILIAMMRVHHVIGTDVLGDYSKPRDASVLAKFLKWGERLLDQPWRTPKNIANNEASNLALLELFQAAR